MADNIITEEKEEKEEVIMTNKEVILSKLKVDGSKVTPIRTLEEAKASMDRGNILDQTYNGRKVVEDYTTISLGDMADRGEEKPIPEEVLDIKAIRHTDKIKVGNSSYTIITAKTATEVLNSLTEGKYMVCKYRVEFSKSDAATVESQIRGFVPSAIDIPRARVSTTLEGNMVVVEPSVNGFQLSVFMEEVSDEDYKDLKELEDRIRYYQGWILEKTLTKMVDLGISKSALVKSQTTVGLVPRARRRYEGIKAREAAGPNERPVITPQIREEGRVFAEALNDQLGLMPLTASGVRFGLDIFTVELTTDKAIIKNWKTSRDSISYFSKGDVTGRIERIVSSTRKIPVFQDMCGEVAETLKTWIPNIVILFENIARHQLKIKEETKPKWDAIHVVKSSSIADLLELDPEDVFKTGQSYYAKANAIIKQHLKIEERKQIKTLLDSLAAITGNGEKGREPKEPEEDTEEDS